MPIKNLPKHQQPREKLVNLGSENLNESELLAILLRTGRSGKSAIDIGKEVLKKVPIKRLLFVQLVDLLKIKGIDVGKATTIVAAMELGRRSLNKYETKLPQISSPQESLPFLNSLLTMKKEHFVALYLNARHQLVHQETVSIGTVDTSIVHPREVFAPAIEFRAVAIILAHNHPSGNLTPSQADIEITNRLNDSGKILGIKIIDHIILSLQGYLSFKEMGLLDV